MRLAEAGQQVSLPLKITDKVNELLKIDTGMTTRQVARCLCILTGSKYKIPKKKIRVSGIAASWIPHSLLDGQKRGRVLIVRKMLKKYPRFNQRHFLIFGQSMKHR